MQLISIIQSLTVISLGDSLRSRFVLHSMNYNAICCSSLELELIQERSIFFCTKKKSIIILKKLGTRHLEYDSSSKWEIRDTIEHIKLVLSCTLLQLTHELSEKLFKKIGGSERAKEPTEAFPVDYIWSWQNFKVARWSNSTTVEFGWGLSLDQVSIRFLFTQLLIIYSFHRFWCSSSHQVANRIALWSRLAWCPILFAVMFTHWIPNNRVEIIPFFSAPSKPKFFNPSRLSVID